MTKEKRIAYILTIIFLTTLQFSYAQDFDYPVLPSQGKNQAAFVPAGWIILDSAYGDLNKDGLNDIVIIIQKRDSVNMINDASDTVLTHPRILAILFQQSNNILSLAEQSNSFILKHDNPSMDDPYSRLFINKGVLEINFSFFYNIGSWYITNTTYKFRFQQKQFVLTGAEKYSFHRATHHFEEYSYNFLTKVRMKTTGKDEKVTRKATTKFTSRPTLQTLKTFIKPFTWQVEKDHYL